MKFQVINKKVILIDRTMRLVGDNEYEFLFEFDEEWEGKVKTARFVMGDYMKDIVLNNDKCLIEKTFFKGGKLKVGVYASNLATEALERKVKSSILEEDGGEPTVPENLWTQLLEIIDADVQYVRGAVSDAEQYAQNAQQYAQNAEQSKLYAQETVSGFGDVVQSKTDEFNTNAAEKQTEYNQNAESKIREYDEHITDFSAEIGLLKDDLTEQDERIAALEQGGGTAGSDGKSAYQIAVDNGFIGTEAEWIESLKGEDGYTPQKGVDYFDGEPGYTPVKGVDYFDGNDGYTPIKGVDYYTDAEKVEIVQAVIDAMGGTLIGAVDSNNIITLTGVLSNETYTVKYEMADGTVIDIGELALSEPEPEIINQIPLSIKSDGTPFIGTNGELGYKTGYRLSLSGGSESAQAGTEVTGFIPVTKDSVIRAKNIAYDSDNTRGVVGYDANFTKLSTGNGVGLATFFAFDDGNGVARSYPLSHYTHFISDNLAYIRLCSTDLNENSILTVDQEIV